MTREPLGVAESRRDFPLLETTTYLNTAAEGLIPTSSHMALADYLGAKSRGSLGRDAMYEVEDRLRMRLAQMLSVTSNEVAFVSSASRGVDAAVQSVAWKPGDNLVTWDGEFPTNIFSGLRLRPRGITLRIIGSEDGRLSYDDLDAQVDEHTRLILLSLVSHRTGFRVNLARVGEVARRVGALVAIDATQALGAIKFDASRADFVIANTFKWCLGIHGAAVMVVSNRVDLQPNYVGWKSVQELFGADRLVTYHPWTDARRYEDGMPAYPAMFVLDRSLDYLELLGINAIESAVLSLAARTISGLTSLGLHVLGSGDPSEQSGIVAFEHEDCSVIASRLADRGVWIWGKDGRVRVSAHFYNSPQDVDVLLDELQALL